MAVMVVDDEAEVRAALRQLLEIEGHEVFEFADSERALDKLTADFPGVVIADLRMPRLDGVGLFARIVRLDPELPVIIISGHGDVATAVDLVRRGAYDFLSKPFDADQLLATVRRALDRRALALENRALRRPQPMSVAGALLGESREIEQVRQTVDQLVQADIDVLVLGESGTGKSLVASTLHGRSPRSRKSLVTVDCRALPGGQAESLLFGHVSGAFAGANFPRTGQLLQADGGTLFLDHVDGLPVELQKRLQQSLELGSVTPVGANQSLSTQFRTLSASGADLDDLARKEYFLPSLFYRLGTYRLQLPPLRARGDDVVMLFRVFLSDESARLGRAPPSLSPPVWRRLKDHDWPGNIRELRSFAVNVALGLLDDRIAVAQVPISKSLKVATASFEALAIRAALERNRGDITATTAELDMPRKTLYDKLTRHAIDPADYRARS